MDDQKEGPARISVCPYTHTHTHTSALTHTHTHTWGKVKPAGRLGLGHSLVAKHPNMKQLSFGLRDSFFVSWAPGTVVNGHTGTNRSRWKINRGQ